MRKLYLDFETVSDVDLKKIGAINYGNDTSTFVSFAGFAIQDGPVHLWEHHVKSERNTDLLRKLYVNLLDPLIEIVAHNAPFEAAIIEGCLGLPLKPERFNCTAARAAAFGLPRSLEQAALALELTHQKNMDGNRLVKKYMKPRPPWKKWKSLGGHGQEPVKFYDDDLELLCIGDYCKTDVEVSREIDRSVPELIPSEKKMWAINFEMNRTGVTVDIPTVNKTIDLHSHEVDDLQAEVHKLTSGTLVSVLQRQKLLDWLEMKGFDYENLQMGTVETALEDESLLPEVRRVLEIRRSVSKTSIKKYQAMVERAGPTNRVTDLTLYHGAATGRDAGRGVQVQNLPKGSIKDVDNMIDVIKTADSYEFVKVFYSETSEVYSSCIRGMFVASPSKSLVVADLNAIECRVLNWVAGNEEVIQAFREGKDPYVVMAARIFKCSPDMVDGAMRFLGKTAELGCGYQMGADRFYQTCISWGVPNVTEELAADAVSIYRETHPKVVALWRDTEYAAIKAIKGRCRVKAGLVTWGFKDGNLYVELPSERRIYFHGATLRTEDTPWGEPRPKVYYWRVDSQTKKWVNRATYGGSMVESVCQGIARDVTMEGIKNLVENGYQYLFQVHDEVVCESENPDLEKFIELLTHQAEWFKTLPVKAEGYISHRYRK